MTDPVERNLGEQPLSGLMKEAGITAHDLVNASTEQLNYKMVSRAVKGRRLTPSVQAKVLRALNAAAGKTYSTTEIFNY